MESPFSDYTGAGDPHEPMVNEVIIFESPFADTRVQGSPAVTSDQLMLDEVHKTGDATFTIADPAKASSDEYREPVPSGNPLLVVSGSARNLKLSANFTAGELASAQSGKYTFDLARIDPDLIRNLQKMRTFIGKPVNVIDGYYSTAYLRNVLGIKDIDRITVNPHISGRGVKIAVRGYDRMMKQLAIAAIVACDTDISLGIGESTMTLYVKQQLSGLPDRPDDFKRIVSYIKDEKTKVAAYTFCVDVKRLIKDYFAVYRQEMEKAVAAFSTIILKIYYRQENIPADWMDWETPMAKVISFMHDKSITKHPDVLLYCIAYSAFGSLYRSFLKNKTESDTVVYLINELTSEKDRQNRFMKGSFLANQNEPDRLRFIDNCRQRIVIGKPDGTAYKPSVNTFFDWMYHPQDKIFKDKLSEFIKNVFITNNYIYDIPPQQTPVGGSHPNVVVSPSDPDKPAFDYTGRYYAAFDPGHETLYGRYVVINQAGNYISGKMGGIFKKTIKDLRGTITEFYGKIDDKGVAICPVYPGQTLMLKTFPDGIRIALVDNSTRKFVFNLPLTVRSKAPVISNLMMNSLSRINNRDRDLLITLAWIQPPPDKLKTFFDSFKTSALDVKKAVSDYYSVDKTVPSQKQRGLNRFISELDTAINNYLKLPPMLSVFSNYYTRFVYSTSEHWSPSGDKERRTLLDWIRKMLSDYRDFKGKNNLDTHYKWLYEYFGLSTEIPEIEYHYDLKIELTSFGIGPFARSSGTITVSNKTDFGKYPGAEKWTNSEYPIVVWNATLSLNPGRWLPKVGSGQTIEASVVTDAPYSASDFSNADIQITEGKLIELPLNMTSGNVKVGTKAGVGAVVILIDGRGKKTLEFTSELALSLPDSIEIEPSVDQQKEGVYEKIAEFLPSLTMYKGKIDSKATDADISSVPLEQKFSENYQLQNTRYFLHDDAELTAQAIEAIGRLCAEELVAFSDSGSRIDIIGHTDASGDPGHNLTLSKNRATNVLRAIKDRLGNKLKAGIGNVEGMGESDANRIYGQYTERNAWLRKVVVLINGRAVLSLGEI